MGPRKASHDEVVCIGALHNEGLNISDISRRVGLSRTCVRLWVSRHKNQQNSSTPERKKGSGRPKCTTSAQDKFLKRQVMLKPSITAKELKEEHPQVLQSMSVRTIQHRLQIDLKMPCKRSVKKPLLTDRMIKKRLAFARHYRHWTPRNWETVMWSDESAFKTIASRSCTVRRPLGANRFDRRYTVPTVKHPPGSWCGAVFRHLVEGGCISSPRMKL